MQIADDTAAARPGSVKVLGPSLVFDLTWTVFGAHSPEYRLAHPEVAARFDGDPALADRVRSFWGDGIVCFLEFELLAALAGALETTDAAELFPAVEGVIGSVPPDLPLRSETPEARQALYRRLDTLRRSRARRHGYFSLLGDLWTGMDPWWQAPGRPQAERAGAEARRRLERGEPWTALAPTGCEIFTEQLPFIVEEHGRGRPVWLVPCALFGKGLYLDLPDAVVVGFPGPGDDGRERREAEALARRLRALADPTRLALLRRLALQPSSVGELARRFELAQPTVSAHVKQLREAGLVVGTRRGSRLELSPADGVAQGLASELAALLTP